MSDGDNMMGDTRNDRISMGPNGVLIYDGSCGVCTASIRDRQAFLGRYGFTICAIHTPGLLEWIGTDEETLMKVIHLKTPDGRLLKGSDCLIEIMSKVGWMKPFSMVLKWPVINKMLAWGYAQLAKRRQTLSRVCGLHDGARIKEK